MGPKKCRLKLFGLKNIGQKIKVKKLLVQMKFWPKRRLSKKFVKEIEFKRLLGSRTIMIQTNFW